MRAILTICIISFLVLFSLYLSCYTVDSDFPVIYSAACTILDPSSPNESVYVPDTFNKYSMPEHVEPAAFIYSMAAAYLLAPLALLPYYIAKATMILLNIMAYLGALSIVMRINGATGRLFVYPLALSCLWPPFIQNLRAGQINALLLFLVAVAAFSAIRKRPVLCGIFLGIASLFKLFPIAIAMVLGLRDRRILATCALVLTATFLIPGSLEWFPAIGNIYKEYTPVYILLMRFGTAWYCLYVMAIAAITALIGYLCKNENYVILTSFAIPAVFLTMPIVEYSHLTFLIFPFIYIITSENKTNRILMSAAIMSIVLISLSFFFSRASYRFSIKPYLSYTLLLLGLFLSWASLAWRLYRGYNVSIYAKP